MKINKCYQTLLALSALACNLASAQTITGFGVGDFTQAFFGNDFTVDSQGSNSISISGNAGNSLSGTFDIPVDIAGATQLELSSGDFSSNTDPLLDTLSLSITLFDSSPDPESATFTGGSFNDLISSGTTTFNFESATSTSVFSGIIGMTISGGGPLMSPITFSGSFDQLVATPEPSTYALIGGILAFGYIAIRRSRN